MIQVWTFDIYAFGSWNREDGDIVRRFGKDGLVWYSLEALAQDLRGQVKSADRCLAKVRNVIVLYEAHKRVLELAFTIRKLHRKHVSL